MIPLLVLRPEPGAAATAARARALGHEAIVAPLFTIAPAAWPPPPPDAFEAVMLTSANALRHGGTAIARYRALPAYAVGTATAAAARAHGFPDVRAGEGDAADLVARMADDGIARALHLCGVERRAVAHPGVRIEAVAVYHADPVAALPEAAQRAIERGAIALLHSPRAAALLGRLVPPDARGMLALAAISPAAADAAGAGWRAVTRAHTPTDAALLAAATSLCEGGG